MPEPEISNESLSSEPTTSMDISGLDPRQEEIGNLLGEKAQKHASCYLGIYRGLEAPNNPDRIPQCAHSARELMEKLEKDDPSFAPTLQSGHVTEEVRVRAQAWTALKSKEPWLSAPPWTGTIDQGLATELERIDELFRAWGQPASGQRIRVNKMVNRLSPALGALPEAATQAFFKDWKSVCGYFNGVSHHTNPTSEAEFLRRLATLDGLLLVVLKPAPLIDMDEIETLITEGEAGL